MSDSDPSDVVNVNREDENVNDLPTAIQKVLRSSVARNGLVRGLNQTVKAIESGKALVCLLSNSCSEPAYTKLVEALCKEHKVPLLEIDGDSKTLGQWAGLCKIDPEGKPRKIVGTSAAAITDYGEQSDALSFLQRHLDSIQVN